MGAIVLETSLPFLTTHIAPQQATRYCLMHLPSCSMQVLVAGFVQILLKAGALHQSSINQSINQSIVYVRGTKVGDYCFSAIFFKTLKIKFSPQLESAMTDSPRQSAHYSRPQDGSGTTPFTRAPSLVIL